VRWPPATDSASTRPGTSLTVVKLLPMNSTRVGGVAAGAAANSAASTRAAARTSYSEPSARLTLMLRSSSSTCTRTSHGLQHTSQSCTNVPRASASTYTSTASPQYGQVTTVVSSIEVILACAVTKRRSPANT